MKLLKKPGKKPLILRALDVIIVLAVLGTLGSFIYQRQQDAQLEATVCRAPGKNYDLALQNDAFSAKSLRVHLCDTVTITNQDTQKYSLNFGDHDKHIVYPGFTAQVQSTDESITIDALEMGTYTLHDHIRDNATLQLTIGPKE